MYFCDLHTHSTASDGQYPPAEVVALAKERGVEVLALTDHDATSGVAEAVAAGVALGVCVVPGVELSAAEHRSLHLLGYQVDGNAPALANLCHSLVEGREKRKEHIADFLREKGVSVPLAEVEALAGGQVIGRPHFARVMVAHGLVQTVEEAFTRYLDTPEFQRIERPKPPAETCLSIIHAAGGKSSLAHPYQLHLTDEALDTLVRRLTDCGLDAIECYYPKHTPAQQAYYLHLAQKYGLHITGGSDFHGETVKPDTVLAHWPLDLTWLL